MELSLPMLLHENHKVLGEEFCSGYSDAFGKWNTGFYCPKLDSEDVYCCGTEFYKYCCTGQEVRTTNEAWNSENGMLMLILGVTFGVAAGIALLVLISCIMCPGCLLYKKRSGVSYRQHLPTRSMSTATTQMTISSFATTPSDVYCIEPTPVTLGSENQSNGFATFRSASQQLNPRYLPTHMPNRESSVWDTDTDSDSDEASTINRRSFRFEPPPPYTYLDPGVLREVSPTSVPPRSDSLSRYDEIIRSSTPTRGAYNIPASRSTKF